MHLGIDNVYIVVDLGSKQGMYVAKPDSVEFGISTAVDECYPKIDAHVAYANLKPLKECVQLNITEEDIMNTFNYEE